jgi:hypothetical protein
MSGALAQPPGSPRGQPAWGGAVKGGLGVIVVYRPLKRAQEFFDDMIPGLRSLVLAHPGLNSVAAPRLVGANVPTCVNDYFAFRPTHLLLA